MKNVFVGILTSIFSLQIISRQVDTVDSKYLIFTIWVGGFFFPLTPLRKSQMDRFNIDFSYLLFMVVFSNLTCLFVFPTTLDVCQRCSAVQSLRNLQSLEYLPAPLIVHDGLSGFFLLNRSSFLTYACQCVSLRGPQVMRFILPFFSYTGSVGIFLGMYILRRFSGTFVYDFRHFRGLRKFQRIMEGLTSKVESNHCFLLVPAVWGDMEQYFTEIFLRDILGVIRFR